MAEVIMPKMGDAMTEGKVLRWIKQQGEAVQVGEALAEIETDKVNVELPADEAGVLAQILVPEGQTVPVGQPIAIIARPGEAAGEAPSAPERPLAAAAPPAPTRAAPKEAPQRVPPEERIKASPLARRLAREHGIDLAEVQGTGPEGRITKEDVEAHLARRAAAAPAPAAPAPIPAAVPPVTEEVPLSRMRRTIARRMSESKQQAPHFYVTVEIRMDEALSVRRQLNEALGDKVVSVNDLIMRAAALALRAYPNLNASFSGEAIRRHGEVHLGFALALPEGLIVPVIRHCDRKGVVEIAREAADLAERARQGRLRPEELQDATFTVSNLGMFEVESFTAIINPPQAAILALGSAQPRPVAEGATVRVAHVMKATLSADHRVTDGAEAARYLGEVRRLLENPVLLVADLSAGEAPPLRRRDNT
ncbi:MAG: dihydrolipoamide acetyltransferase family protein [Armatimonadota bacterium]|nr:dihydrolipoamide acetyltransferase family protein [Armatimonadota bacterium]MDR7464324.1 dihydrolipoamide acetyltransferase family protein [Armatimonadota bacterium]MDR7470708.1 dihydrolipoamide acetyltransferase family protein [Armatimonadota bacterium]MDR7475673.1 dihydrolipoamide acetyltransferase family protein [Armatimonadota bacterium]MDR7540349.1 dihydrolipoamide acetyltransferase family protein [Armatimonadota bacterium]